MPLPKKTTGTNPLHFWVLILILAAAIISSIFMIETSPDGSPANSNGYNTKEWSRKLIEVKKDPLPKEWKRPNFLHFPNNEAKQKAAVDVVYNAMLSRVETLAGIPTALPPETVAQDQEKYLSQVYGSAANVPSVVYRMACLRIVNTQVDFQKFYAGSPKNLETIVYRVIAEYYDLGKPPVTLTVSSAEDYFRHHKIKRPKHNK